MAGMIQLRAGTKASVDMATIVVFYTRRPFIREWKIGNNDCSIEKWSSEL